MFYDIVITIGYFIDVSQQSFDGLTKNKGFTMLNGVYCHFGTPDVVLEFWFVVTTRITRLEYHTSRAVSIS